MQFGLFFELSVPRPFTGDIERRVFENALEQARVADELGFDSLWVVEHHFLEEYSHCSAPEIFLTACAMQTKSIRLGHGAVVCVPEMNHPIRVAERAAMLDVLSGGRLARESGRSRLSYWKHRRRGGDSKARRSRPFADTRAQISREVRHLRWPFADTAHRPSWPKTAICGHGDSPRTVQRLPLAYATRTDAAAGGASRAS
jgi:alkanesulfonate monooxygenase SsuD/methylene tetrahydromethanopterin reductase-like flavin-dependent oxidoreductase (luciferase family)